MTAYDIIGRPDLRCSIFARFDWPIPPANQAEAAMREHANRIVAKAAHDLQEAVKLLVIQLAEARTK